jgi:hypothetical protein
MATKYKKYPTRKAHSEIALLRVVDLKSARRAEKEGQ